MKKDSRNDSVQEMEQIRKGLEAFLNQEILKPETEKNRGEESELDIIDIGARDRGVQSGTDRRVHEDYVEDWDSPIRRRQAEVQQKGTVHAYSDGIRAKQSREQEKEMRVKKKRNKRKSGVRKFLVMAAVFAVVLGAGGYYLVGRLYAKMNYQGIESVAAESIREDDVVNVLLIGSDSRDQGMDGRSDAMILLSVSDKTDKIYMTSLLRDMYVDIPGYKGNRLNAAYAYGGPELLMETIETNFDITVNRYVVVNFEAFANLVDAVNGIDLELTSEEIEYVNGYLVEYNMLMNRPQGTDNMDTSISGLVHLNGAQALAYSRNRYLGTDFGRTERQRKILTAVIQKAPKALLTNSKELMEGLLPNLTTNLTQNEVMQLSLMAPKILTHEIVQGSIPLEGTYQNATIRDMAVLEVDFEANKQYFQENIYGVTREK